jgi:transposase
MEQKMELNLIKELANESEAITTKRKSSYPQEFRDQVVGVYKSGVYASVDECAAAYSISNKTLYGWLHKYNQSTSPKAISEQQSELARVKKELARAKMENEILKKAAIYFANQAR